LVRSVQYAGLLLPQPTSPTTVAAVATTKGTRTQALPWRARDLLCFIVVKIYRGAWPRPYPGKVISVRATARTEGSRGRVREDA
jgi:hypothetical protein